MLQNFVSVLGGDFDKTYWIARYRSTDNLRLSRAHSVLDSNGNIYSVFSKGDFGSQALVVIKQNSSADIIWERLIEPSLFSFFPRGITIKTTGNLVIWGGFANVSPYYESGFILEINPSGTLVLSRRITGTDPFDFNDRVAVALTSDNSFGIAVSTQSQTWGGFDIVPMRLNSSGNLVWRSVVGDSQTQTANTVIHDSSNNLLIAGITYVSGITGDNMLLVKINTSGNIVWAKRWQGNGLFNLPVYTLNTDNLNNIYLMTETHVRDGASIIKFDSNGNILWQKKLATSRQTRPLGISVRPGTGEIFFAIYPDGDGRYLLTGALDSSGSLLWSQGIRVASSAFYFAPVLSCFDAVRGTDTTITLSGDTSISGLQSIVAKLPRAPLAIGQFGEFAVTNDYPISVTNDTWGSAVNFTSNGGVPDLINPSSFGTSLSASTNVNSVYTSYTGG